MREPTENELGAALQAVTRHGARDVDRQGGPEEVAVLLEGLDVRFFFELEGLAPVPKKDVARLIGNQRIDRLRAQLRGFAGLFYDRGDERVAARDDGRHALFRKIDMQRRR